MPTFRAQTGVNLLELLVTLSIISILYLVSAPSIAHAFSSMNAKAELYQLQSFISDARKHALLQSSHVHICSLEEDKNQCAELWKDELISFIDKNKNSQFDAGDKLLARVQLDNPSSWLKSKSLNYIRFNQLGMNMKIGSIIFCYKKSLFVEAKKINASMQGRFKVIEQSKEDCKA